MASTTTSAKNTGSSDSGDSGDSGGIHAKLMHTLRKNKKIFKIGGIVLLVIVVIVIIIVAIMKSMNNQSIDHLQGKIGKSDQNAGLIVVEHSVHEDGGGGGDGGDEDQKCSGDGDCSSSNVCDGKGSGCCPMCAHGKCQAGMVTATGCQAHQAECHKDSDCAAKNVCGGKENGCCASCVNGTCTAGMLTASGCIPGSHSNAYGNSGSSDASMKYGAAAAAPAPASPSSSSLAAFESEMSCASHQDAYLKACFMSGDHSEHCCAVCVNGMSVPGTRGSDGVCQTTVQQAGYTGMGQQPPNTYMISSTGPRVGVSMGSCTVEPMGSGLTMHSAFH